jgi:hypothetical protein
VAAASRSLSCAMESTFGIATQTCEPTGPFGLVSGGRRVPRSSGRSSWRRRDSAAAWRSMAAWGLIGDRDAVEEFAADGADEAFGDGIRPRRPHRRLDDSDGGPRRCRPRPPLSPRRAARRTPGRGPYSEHIPIEANLIGPSGRTECAFRCELDSVWNARSRVWGLGYPLLRNTGKGRP